MSSNNEFQNSYYVGNQFVCLLYGVEVMMYYSTMKCLLKSKRRGRGNKNDNLFIAFSTALLILITIYSIVEVAFGQEMWIINVDYPGGSAQYLADNVSVWYQTMGTVAAIALNLLTDGLLIYRTYVVWQDVRAIVLPCFLWIASLGVGVASLVFSGSPSGDFFAGLAEEVGLAYYCISIANNVILTSMICGRILYYGRQAGQHLGQDAQRRYTTVASVVVESAMPYTIFAIAFVVAYGLQSGIAIFFQSIYVMFTCVSPQMIVYRVAKGRGWTKEQTSTSMTHSGIYFTDSTTTRGIRDTSRATQDTTDTAGTAIHLRSFGKSDLSIEPSSNDDAIKVRV